jgi:hypothetical protein
MPSKQASAALGRTANRKLDLLLRRRPELPRQELIGGAAYAGAHAQDPVIVFHASMS